jgi:DegV family protein with EDD domain
MTIKIVTDSSSDLATAVAQELRIGVVPLYVRFGEEVFREQVDMDSEEFYQRLIKGQQHPVTIQPSPQDFVAAYRKLAPDTEGIVSVHLSSKLSGTYNSAIQGKEMSGVNTPIEVIDSRSVSAGLGLVSIMAAEIAASGASLSQVVEQVKAAIPKVHLIGLVDTLKYLLLGGRIGKARALVGSLLNVKPLLTLEDGETVPVGQARTRAKGIERLHTFVTGAGKIADAALAYSTTPEEASLIATKIKDETGVPVRLSRLGTTLGVHLGPGSLILAYRASNK